MSRRTQYLAYAAFTMFAVFMAALLTFPYDVLGRKMETMAAQAMPGATLVVGRVGPALPLGIKLGDITFTMPGKEGQPGIAIKVDKLRITPVWLKLITLKPAIAFAIETFGGEVTGSAALLKDSRQVEIKIDPSRAMTLQDGMVLERLSGFELQGAVSGKVSVKLDTKGVITSGTVDALVDTAMLKGGKVMGFPIPAVDFGAIELGMTIEKGEGKIDTFKAKSADVEAGIGNGTIHFSQDLPNSTIHGKAKVKFTDAWFAKNPTIKSFMGLAGPMKKPDGSLEIDLSGPLSHPVNLPGFGHF